MQIAQRLAGYTLGGADLLRRAMGKKKPEEMAQQRGIFVAGAGARGIDSAIASQIFDLMEKFAGYGFNKSHAAAYALVSYQTAWLKAHYPAEFMAAVMSAEMNHTDTVVVMLDECRRMRLNVMAPDVNRSLFRFTVNERGEILYGLGAIKGAGEGALAGIIAERDRGGAFRDLFDFCRRIDTRKVNKRVLEALIFAGALDCLHGAGGNRPGLLKLLPKALQLAEQTAAEASTGQNDLFGLAAPAPGGGSDEIADPEPDWPGQQRLAREKEVLGLYFSGHPIEDYRALIEQVCGGATIKKLIDECNAGASYGYGGGGDDDDAPAPPRRAPRRTVMLAGWLTDIRNVGGDRPGKIVVIDDRSAQIIAWLGFEDWQRYQHALRKDSLVFATGEIRTLQREGRDPESRLYPRAFWDLDTVIRDRAERVTLRWPGALAPDALRSVLELWRAPNGGAAVTVEYCNGNARAVLDLGPQWRLRAEEASLNGLRKLLGEAAVRVDYRRWAAPAPAGLDEVYSE
jgi:DNA polymerase-3 subunit alpha